MSHPGTHKNGIGIKKCHETTKITFDSYCETPCRGEGILIKQTLPKAQRARGLSSAYLFRPKTSSRTNLHHQNLDQASTSKSQTLASRLNLNLKILTKPSFRISTKIQIRNLYKTLATKYLPAPASKSCLNFNFKILTKPCAQSLNKSLAF